ncbi:hypothetical protein GCM10010174_24560 [Kutzneria viridogrisea]|uniref:tetratricopeptide repeat protein n=1 Tax=Kutzneria viridogrisea TaxID=47990 RepID=UPI0031F83C49
MHTDAINAVGRHEEAIPLLERAVRRYEADEQREADSLHSLGIAHQGRGSGHQALEYFERSLELDRELGDLYYEAFAHWRQALELLDRLGHADAEQVRRKLGLAEGRGAPRAG